MMNKTELINKLTEEEKKKFLEHFDAIYECKQLGEHEYKIIYLAWLWANGYVFREQHGMSEFNESEVGISLDDYEITFEDEDSGGVNLDTMYMYYGIDEMIELMSWKKA